MERTSDKIHTSFIPPFYQDFETGGPMGRVLHRPLRILLIVLIAIGFLNAPPLRTTRAACAISGTVYRDYNNDGQQGATEPGQGGVTVTAYSVAGLSATTTTADDGSYTLNTADNQVRLEFTGFGGAGALSFLQSGPFGNASRTTVTFVDCAGGPATVDFGLNNPGDYCQSTPNLTTTCYVRGDQVTAPNSNRPVLVSFPYDAGAQTTQANTGNLGAPWDAPAHLNKAVASQIGTVWGMAYQRRTDSLFALPFVRRHTGVLNNELGILYRVVNVSSPAVSAVQQYMDFGAEAGTDPRTPATDYLTDANAYDAVGNIGWGDLDISDDDTTLYAVNLNTNQLYIIPIGRVPIPAPPLASVTRLAIPAQNCPAAAWHPFAVTFHELRVYIGAVCGAAGNLNAYVLSTGAQGGAFVQEFSFALTYPRRCLNGAPPPCSGLAPAVGSGNWNAWTTLAQFQATFGAAGGDISYPQPMFTKLQFDNGDLIIALRDRFGDMMGDQNSRGPRFPTDPNLYNVRGGGDILRACANGAGGWTLESGGICGGMTTSGSDPSFAGQGPGGGEYYFGDTFPTSHDETTMGGMVYIPGLPDVAVNAFDPVPISSQIFQGGVRWLDNRTTGTYPYSPVNIPDTNNPAQQSVAGNVSRAYRIYNSQTDPPGTSAGKANGLGDLEALCGPQPLEIGNRVWEDLDRNGQQDPGEQPLAGVTVSLFKGNLTRAQVPTATPIAVAVTNANGEYYFRNYTGALVDPNPADEFGIVPEFLDIDGDRVQDPNEPGGILAFTDYTVALSDPANYGGGPLTPYYATRLKSVPLQRDSDGEAVSYTDPVSATNFPMTTLTTGDFGDNNHTYDFGFALQPPTQVTPLPPTSVPGAPGCGLNMDKVVEPPFAMPGDTVTWIIRVHNPCSAPVTNFIVTDDIPAGLTILSTDPSTGVTINGQKVTFTVGSIGAGQTIELKIVVRVNKNIGLPFSVTNLAQASTGQTAQATLVSVSNLPATGEEPWWRLPLLVIGGAAALGAAVFGFMRLRRAR
jgi:uncharacterized repeat protein (TIGR01451 family)